MKTVNINAEVGKLDIPNCMDNSLLHIKIYILLYNDISGHAITFRVPPGDERQSTGYALSVCHQPPIPGHSSRLMDHAEEELEIGTY